MREKLNPERVELRKYSLDFGQVFSEAVLHSKKFLLVTSFISEDFSIPDIILNYMSNIWSFLDLLPVSANPKDIVDRDPSVESFQSTIKRWIKGMNVDKGQGSLISRNPAESKEKTANFTFFVSLFYGPNVYCAWTRNGEIKINGESFDRLLKKKHFEQAEGLIFFWGVIYETRPCFVQHGEIASFTYDPLEDYSNPEIPGKNKFRRCYKKMPDTIYRLEGELPLYYHKSQPAEFDYTCGRISYDSLADCDMGGLVPEEYKKDLRRGLKKVKVGMSPAYYCARQIERDNPDYSFVNKKRVHKGASEVFNKRTGKVFHVEDLCRRDLNCRKFYDPLELLNYTAVNPRTPIRKENLYPYKFLPEETEPSEVRKYLNVFYKFGFAIYPPISRWLLTNFNPHICISIYSSKKKKIEYTQPITEQTKVFIFYIVPDYSSTSGHAKVLLVDFQNAVIVPIDSYFLSVDPERLKRKAARLVERRVDLFRKKLYVAGYVDPPGYQGEDRLSDDVSELYDDELFYDGSTVLNVYRCPENIQLRIGAQTHSMDNDLSCFMWGIFFVLQILKNFDQLDVSRNFYITLERDLNSAVVERGGIPRTIASFLLFAVETIFRMSEEERERAFISDRDLYLLETIGLELWKVNPDLYASFMGEHFPPKKYQEFFSRIKRGDSKVSDNFSSGYFYPEEEKEEENEEQKEEDRELRRMERQFEEIFRKSEDWMN